MNKIIVIEGTDCSGKETQSKLLVEKLNKNNIKTSYISFPNYDSPTGKIIAGPYLGKTDKDELGNKIYQDSLFKEGAPLVDPKVSSLYYAADRLYNLNEIKDKLEKNNLVLNRYVYSNMAHQGGKISNEEERKEMYNWIEKLEFDLLNLPKADIKIFLHMPYKYSNILKNKRLELDQNELDSNHLINAEKAYLELVKKYNFKTIECVKNDEIRPIEEINDEIFDYVKENL
jgi:dTMP kinase